MKRLKSGGVNYRVERSRRSTADVIIERDGSVFVRAPEWADDDLVAEIVRSKDFWIYQKLAEWRDLNSTRVLREYRNGEGFLYLGRAHRLQLVSDQEEALKLANGRFALRRDLVEAGSIASAARAFQDFYVEKGLDRLRKRVDYYAPKVGVDPSGVGVSDLGHRWATCSRHGKLSFHWKCVMAPSSVIDYIVVHELCHLHYHDHTNAFWNEVDKVMPDFRERKEWLRRNGASLDL